MRSSIFTKTYQTVIDKRGILLRILFFALFVMFLYFAYKTVSMGYLPIHSDEYGYYLSAKAFQLCNSVAAAATIDEYYSVVGHASFYGFGYTVFFGLFFKFFSLLGITPSIMLVNIILLSIFFILMAISKISLEEKLYIGIVFLSNFIFILYLSVGMTEIFHFIFGALMGYLLYLIFDTGARKYFYLYIVLVFFLAFFRPSWIFALFALLALSDSVKDFLKYSLLILLGFIYVMFVEKYFFASFPYSFMYVMMNYLHEHSLAESFSMFFGHFTENVENYFIKETYDKSRFVFYYKYLYVFLMLYAFYEGIRSGKRSILAGATIAFVFIASILLIYDAFDWHEIRVLAAPFMVLVVILILNHKYFPIWIIILFQLGTIYDVVQEKRGYDWIRGNMHTNIRKSQSLVRDFTQFEKYIVSHKKRNILIVIDYNTINLDYSPLLYQLPLKVGDKCIRYSFVLNPQFDMKQSNYDVFVSNRPVDRGGMRLIGKNKTFYFYQRVK